MAPFKIVIMVCFSSKHPTSVMRAENFSPMVLRAVSSWSLTGLVTTSISLSMPERELITRRTLPASETSVSVNGESHHRNSFSESQYSLTFNRKSVEKRSCILNNSWERSIRERPSTNSIRYCSIALLLSSEVHIFVKIVSRVLCSTCMQP